MQEIQLDWKQNANRQWKCSHSLWFSGWFKSNPKCLAQMSLCCFHVSVHWWGHKKTVGMSIWVSRTSIQVLARWERESSPVRRSLFWLIWTQNKMGIERSWNRNARNIWTGQRNKFQTGHKFGPVTGTDFEQFPMLNRSPEQTLNSCKIRTGHRNKFITVQDVVPVTGANSEQLEILNRSPEQNNWVL